MTFTTKDIAVVILNWNGKTLLERFLPSVTSYSDKASVYVVDNASTDTSVDFLKSNSGLISNNNFSIVFFMSF